MNRSGLEWKVGLFVLISLGLAAALIMKFSKSSSVWTKTYDVLLVASNVGGIRAGASVLMAGVQVGTVSAVTLDESGKIVTMRLQVHSQFRLHKDARFTIEQAGFLGDQFISITPGANRELLKPGETVRCEEPFNLQEVARSAAGLLGRVDQTAAKMNEAVGRIDQTILAEHTLTNFSAAVLNFRVVSERALSTLHGVDELVHTNSHPLSTVISNLVSFSEQLDQVTTELKLTVVTNRVEITTAVKNLQTSTVHLRDLLGDLQAGKGLAGSILKDESLKLQFAAMIDNFTTVSSNLSQHGLLWKPRPRRVPSTNIIYPGKLPSR